ncbi:MAG TPA: HD domain-containing protein [Syntrophales bacterium]|nr:HD domain-containing protein [Syntrophales bacterium]
MVRYVDLITDAVQSGRKDDAAQSPASAIPESFFSRAAQAPAVKEPDSDRDVYLALWKQMQSIKAGIREKTGFDILPLKEQVRAIAGSPDLLDRLYHYTTRFGNEEDYTASHSINTMIYALKIALRLEYAPEDLEALGLAALLHDVGMFAVPDSILLKPEPLSPGEAEAVRRHPEAGRDTLAPWSGEMPWLAQTAFEHHELEDGSGYPRGIRGEQISEFAKIVGLASTYEAMTHDRPHRRCVSVRELIDTKNRSFSPRVMRAFLEQISLYPVGSFVRLNNRTLGRVIRTHAGQPLRPVMQIMEDADGNRVAEDRTVNLLGNPILWVTGAVSEEELARLTKE